jgi:hypothetical protein
MLRSTFLAISIGTLIYNSGVAQSPVPGAGPPDAHASVPAGRKPKGALKASNHGNSTSTGGTAPAISVTPGNPQAPSHGPASGPQANSETATNGRAGQNSAAGNEETGLFYVPPRHPGKNHHRPGQPALTNGGKYPPTGESADDNSAGPSSVPTPSKPTTPHVPGVTKGSTTANTSHLHHTPLAKHTPAKPWGPTASTDANGRGKSTPAHTPKKPWGPDNKDKSTAEANSGQDKSTGSAEAMTTPAAPWKGAATVAAQEQNSTSAAAASKEVAKPTKPEPAPTSPFPPASVPSGGALVAASVKLDRQHGPGLAPLGGAINATSIKNPGSLNAAVVKHKP